MQINHGGRRLLDFSSDEIHSTIFEYVKVNKYERLSTMAVRNTDKS